MASPLPSGRVYEDVPGQDAILRYVPQPIWFSKPQGRMLKIWLGYLNEESTIRNEINQLRNKLQNATEASNHLIDHNYVMRNDGLCKLMQKMLPRELRDMVYDCLLGADRTRSVYNHHNGGYAMIDLWGHSKVMPVGTDHVVPDQQTRRELQEYAYRTLHFGIQDLGCTKHFLLSRNTALNSHVGAFVRHLELHIRATTASLMNSDWRDAYVDNLRALLTLGKGAQITVFFRATLNVGRASRYSNFPDFEEIRDSAQLAMPVFLQLRDEEYALTLSTDSLYWFIKAEAGNKKKGVYDTYTFDCQGTSFSIDGILGSIKTKLGITG